MQIGFFAYEKKAICRREIKEKAGKIKNGRKRSSEKEIEIKKDKYTELRSCQAPVFMEKFSDFAVEKIEVFGFCAEEKNHSDFTVEKMGLEFNFFRFCNS